MRRFRYRLPIVIFVALLVLVVVLVPLRSQARPAPVSDFVPPMSLADAQLRVSQAQQADAQQRAALTRTLNPTDANTLPLAQNVYVAQTGQHISDRAGFLRFWRENGGVLIFGYPISGEIIEQGRVVQYFERAKFELHPENADPAQRVTLALLGTELAAGRTFPTAAPDAGERYFPETQHTLSNRFLKFWSKRGGLPIFGYPISEPIEEQGGDGQTRIVQYFERARFEYHPEDMGGFYRGEEQSLGITLATLHEIELGDLGRQAAQRAGYGFAQNAKLTGAPDWSAALWTRHIDVDLSQQHLTAYEDNVPVYSAPVATGKDGFDTPTGDFAIYAKYPMETMTGSAGGETWYVPSIPWVQYVVGGVALHGTYWHDQWGTGFRLSHGCINLNMDDAQWLYEWADVGTSVSVHY